MIQLYFLVLSHIVKTIVLQSMDRRLLKKIENDEFYSLSLSSSLTSEVSDFISSAGCVIKFSNKTFSLIITNNNVMKTKSISSFIHFPSLVNNHKPIITFGFITLSALTIRTTHNCKLGKSDKGFLNSLIVIEIIVIRLKLVFQTICIVNMRLDCGDKGINPLDTACHDHYIFHATRLEKDLKKKKTTRKEKIVAYTVINAMKA
ncbi:Uncharacterized protein FWK35_00016690 [Aphis craccivora]|uniref:Uncharacterized protein n=1 Tax=Aphis craccivora TaxID=307492 RepID=A0A6G0Y2G8_APHCR|nr:Uncharacterized protein FWK35_00016690 [Aphis craccivora]